jgi:hypothetical protein
MLYPNPQKDVIITALGDSWTYDEISIERQGFFQACEPGALWSSPGSLLRGAKIDEAT